MIFILLVFLAAIFFYVFGIAKSYKDEYYDDELSTPLMWASILTATAFMLIVLYLYIDSYFDSAAYNLQSSALSSLIEFLFSFVGFKMLFVIYFGSFLAAFIITYLITFLGLGFQEQRKMIFVIGVIYLSVVVIILIGFTVFTKAIASILGLIATFLGILISLKKLKEDK